MKFSIRTLLILICVIAFFICSTQQYIKWRYRLHLSEISVSFYGSAAAAISGGPSEFYIEKRSGAEVGNSATSPQIGLLLKTGYYNHAGTSFNTAQWAPNNLNGYPIWADIFSDEQRFRFEIRGRRVYDIENPQTFPKFETTFSHFQESARKTKIVIDSYLIDENGRRISSRTKAITITDSGKRGITGR